MFQYGSVASFHIRVTCVWFWISEMIIYFFVIEFLSVLRIKVFRKSLWFNWLPFAFGHIVDIVINYYLLNVCYYSWKIYLIFHFHIIFLWLVSLCFDSTIFNSNSSVSISFASYLQLEAKSVEKWHIFKIFFSGYRLSHFI